MTSRDPVCTVVCMASSAHGVSAWPPPTVWRAAFRKQYSHSSFSKWHQLYVDVSCVLLELKSAFLVDYVTPSAEKLQLFLKDVKQADMTDKSHAETVDRSSRSCVEVATDFSKCLGGCCIVSLGEDILLVNMKLLVSEHGQSVDTDIRHAQRKALDTRPIYVDVTKGLPTPRLLQDKERMDIESRFCQWLTKMYSSFLSRDSSDITIIPCEDHEVVEFETDCSRMNTVIEQNGCTLFGQLLGYPVVYWFDRERGYSLDAVELVCYTVTVRNRPVEVISYSGHKACSAFLNIEQVWETIIHSWYGLL